MSLDAVLETIPQVRWPEEDGTFKVVQFLVDGQPYIRFGPRSCQGEHTSIATDFAREIGAEIRREILGSRTINLFTDEARYQIAGAGRCELKGRRAEFYGLSVNYEIMINEGHLGSIRQICPDREIAYNPSRFK